MSKNTGASKFRKVNVDEFDENNYQDDAVEDAGGKQKVDEGEIQSLLNSKRSSDALQLLLKNAPVGSTDKKEQSQALSLIIRVLSSFKSSEIEAAVSKLDKDTLDVLMKYLYKGMAEPTDSSCPVFLTWHEKVYAAGGLGSIMRVLTDRKGV